MKTLSLALLLTAALVSAACVGTTPPQLPPETHPNAQPGTAYITTDPPGASIQVNGKSIGPAPCTADLPVSLVGDRWLLKESTTIMALPAKRGQLLQTQFFARWTEPPKDVTFQMHEKPTRADDEEDPF